MPSFLQHFIARSPTVAAIVIMLTGMLLFTVNDVIGKWMTGSFAVGQLIFLRSLMALIILAPFLWRAGPRRLLTIERPWMLVLRVVLTVVDSFAFYYAVSLLPLADVMTYWLAAPIYVAAMAPLLLGEHVGWRRWTAIGFGFLGVIVALEPSGAMFTAAAVVSVGGSLAFGFTLLSARTLRSVPGIAMIFWQTLGGVLFGLMTLPYSWTGPTLAQWPFFVVLGVLAMLAHIAVNWSFKLADAATVAPLQYTQLLWAILFGWLVFGDFPSAAKLIGATMIIASGLFIFFRERQVRRGLDLPVSPE